MDEKELRLALLARNIVVLEGKVCGKMVDYVAGAIAVLATRDNPPITVNIMSNGGDVNAGLDIYDILSVYPNTITGVVAAYARSMGTVILQACSTRAAYQHAKILIHHITRQEIALDVLRDPEKLKEVLEDLEKSQEYLYRILSNRSGQSVDRVREVCKVNEDMSTLEALQFGLIDSIVPIRKDIVLKQKQTD